MPGLEAGLTDGGIADFIPDWPQRRRADALLSDLARLGASEPAAANIELVGGRGALLGTAYVLEGSRLGGAILVRSVDPTLRGVATAYLDHGTGLKLWPRFVDILNASALSGAEQQAAIDAANQIFMLFERELEEHFEPDGAVSGR